VRLTKEEIERLNGLIWKGSCERMESIIRYRHQPVCMWFC
jgi:hypothetical protein